MWEGAGFWFLLLLAAVLTLGQWCSSGLGNGALGEGAGKREPLGSGSVACVGRFALWAMVPLGLGQ